MLQGRAPTQVDPSYFNVHSEPVVYDPGDSCKGMRFELSVKPLLHGGTLQLSDTQIAVHEASEVLLLMSAATSFNGFDHCPYSAGRDEHQWNQTHLAKASQQSYAQLLRAHVADFRRYFDRVSLQLNPAEADKSRLATDTRLEAYTQGATDSECVDRAQGLAIMVVIRRELPRTSRSTVDRAFTDEAQRSRTKTRKIPTRRWILYAT
jgi:alpha-L-fucosidase 2